MYLRWETILGCHSHNWGPSEEDIFVRVLALALGNTRQCPSHSTPIAIAMKSSSFELESELGMGYSLVPKHLGCPSQSLPWAMLYLGVCTFIFKELHLVHGAYNLQAHAK